MKAMLEAQSTMPKSITVLVHIEEHSARQKLPSALPWSVAHSPSCVLALTPTQSTNQPLGRPIF